jgi:hypothetical protein
VCAVQLRDFSIRLICCGVYVLVSCRPAIPADLTLYNKLYICYGLWHGGRIWTCLQAGDTTNMTAFLCVIVIRLTIVSLRHATGAPPTHSQTLCIHQPTGNTLVTTLSYINISHIYECSPKSCDITVPTVPTTAAVSTTGAAPSRPLTTACTPSHILEQE